MGAATSNAFWLSPDIRPDYQKDPIFDPQYGFDKPRVPRKMIATEEELNAANIPPENRDYCSHLLIKYFACREQKFPLTYFCKDERNAYSHCEYDEYVIIP
ncbi:hypothetical protein HELRODRAFT_77768 [Helobdella robusta]|uniref:NADH dehydrogenase [ubiquinone] 1 beta subcomplex subunit 7 n=1 Tax=Helobdella robusta TaxID=6412 RepID=T1G337_HELRO|nr:hypothetical protein HELRODRAFT_77768 [Helobdella robusta]ESO05218.1 hypothetical protein HELRODRAFT_77768 [Helobdella robusta]